MFRNRFAWTAVAVACLWNPLARAQEGVFPGGAVLTDAAFAHPVWSSGGGGSGERLRLGFEYLGWWAKGDRVPPLLSGSVPGTPVAQAGVLGAPGVSVLYGNQALNDGFRSGWRATATWWLSDGLGVDFGAFGLGQRGEAFRSAPSDTGITSRPFFNAEPPGEDAQLINYPGIVSGSAAIGSSSNFFGANVGLRMPLGGGCGCNPCCGGPRGGFDLLAGYRFLQLNDRLSIHEDLTATATDSDIQPGTRLLVSDRFRTRNTYHGGYLGLAWTARRGDWFAELTARLGIGNLSSRASIAGDTAVTTPDGGTATSVGGLLTQASNIGERRVSRVVFVPEVGVKVGRMLGERSRIFVGYDFLLLPSAVRPGNVLDRTLNTNQLPPAIPGGPARPGFAPSRSNYWLQGFTAGLELRF